MKYRIAWMFPDILFMHGERGNVLALKRYAEEFGYEVTVDRVDFDTADFDPDHYDAIMFGVGEISSFSAIIEWLKGYESSLRKYIDSGRPMLVTGTSQGIFANEIQRLDGQKIAGLGYYPAVFKERVKVYGDDIIIDCKYNGKDLKLVGSQIMMVNIEDAEEIKHFGYLNYGYGNTGQDRNEGYIIRNTLFTNMLGPLLICNPWLTVEMIRCSAEYRGDKLPEIDETFELEHNSADAKITFNNAKEKELTNCQ